MRPSTSIWVEMMNPGQPNDRKRINGTVQEMIPEMAKWLLTVIMGDHIRIVVARTEEELNTAIKRKNPSAAAVDDIMGELEAILAKTPMITE